MYAKNFYVIHPFIINSEQVVLDDRYNSIVLSNLEEF